MKTKIIVLALLVSFYAWTAVAQDQPSRTTPSQKTQSQPASGDHQPPPQAYEDCRGKKAGDTVQHTTPEGTVAATCQDSPQGLVARPKRPKGDQSGNPSGDRSVPKSSLRGTQSRETPQRHSIEQAVSDRAQLHTIAFNSEMFSRYASSLEADTYFCPERHGMYFGGFGMKTAPAVGKQDYAISTSLTRQQKENLVRTRSSGPSDPRGPFLYSSPITMPKIENTDFLFGMRQTNLHTYSSGPGAQG
jgi:hypothetical protein